MPGRAWLAALVVLVTGCFVVEPRDCLVHCSAGQRTCPLGTTCDLAEGRCRLAAATGSCLAAGDGGAPDASATIDASIVDASTTVDASATVDASTTVDASSTTDASTTVDASADAAASCDNDGLCESGETCESCMGDCCPSCLDPACDLCGDCVNGCPVQCDGNGLGCEQPTC